MFKRARISTSAVEKLAMGDVLMDVGLSGYGVRRLGGGCVYFVRKHVDGRRHYLTIGEGWTEAKARQKALLILAALKRGADPGSERAKARAMPTLAEFAASFIEREAFRLKPGTIANYRSLLVAHVALEPRTAPGGSPRTIRANVPPDYSKLLYSLTDEELEHFIADVGQYLDDVQAPQACEFLP